MHGGQGSRYMLVFVFMCARTLPFSVRCCTHTMHGHTTIVHINMPPANKHIPVIGVAHDRTVPHSLTVNAAHAMCAIIGRAVVGSNARIICCHPPTHNLKGQGACATAKACRSAQLRLNQGASLQHPASRRPGKVTGANNSGRNLSPPAPCDSLSLALFCGVGDAA